MSLFSNLMPYSYWGWIGIVLLVLAVLWRKTLNAIGFFAFLGVGLWLYLYKDNTAATTTAA